MVHERLRNAMADMRGAAQIRCTATAKVAAAGQRPGATHRSPFDLHKENFYEQRYLHRRPGGCRPGRLVFFWAALRRQKPVCKRADYPSFSLEATAGACPADG